MIFNNILVISAIHAAFSIAFTLLVYFNAISVVSVRFMRMDFYIASTFHFLVCTVISILFFYITILC